MIEIKSRYDGRVLYTAKTATDVGGALVEAASSGADLHRADLRGANCGADLRGAYLRGAYLSGAYLSGANLCGAYLSGALGVNPLLTAPLHVLKDQVGKIRAYKMVTADGKSPMQTNQQLQYAMGETIEVANADTDPNRDCGAGINVATMDWVLRNYRPGYRVLVVEFEADDIACIPASGDGKFRCHRVTVVGEKDLATLGVEAVVVPV